MSDRSPTHSGSLRPSNEYVYVIYEHIEREGGAISTVEILGAYHDLSTANHEAEGRKWSRYSDLEKYEWVDRRYGENGEATIEVEIKDPGGERYDGVTVVGLVFIQVRRTRLV